MPKRWALLKAILLLIFTVDLLINMSWHHLKCQLGHRKLNFIIFRYRESHTYLRMKSACEKYWRDASHPRAPKREGYVCVDGQWGGKRVTDRQLGSTFSRDAPVKGGMGVAVATQKPPPDSGQQAAGSRTTNSKRCSRAVDRPNERDTLDVQWRPSQLEKAEPADRQSRGRTPPRLQKRDAPLNRDVDLLVHAAGAVRGRQPALRPAPANLALHLHLRPAHGTALGAGRLREDDLVRRGGTRSQGPVRRRHSPETPHHALDARRPGRPRGAWLCRPRPASPLSQHQRQQPQVREMNFSLLLKKIMLILAAMKCVYQLLYMHCFYTQIFGSRQVDIWFKLFSAPLLATLSKTLRVLKAYTVNFRYQNDFDLIFKKKIRTCIIKAPRNIWKAVQI